MPNPVLQQLKRDISALKREMRANSVRVISCMNAGLTDMERTYNGRLFALKTAVDRLGRNA